MRDAAVNGLDMDREVHGDGPPPLPPHGGTGSIPDRRTPSFSGRFQIIAPERTGHLRRADAA